MLDGLACVDSKTRQFIRLLGPGMYMHVELLLVPVDPSGHCVPLIVDSRVRQMRRGLSVG